LCVTDCVTKKVASEIRIPRAYFKFPEFSTINKFPEVSTFLQVSQSCKHPVLLWVVSYCHFGTTAQLCRAVSSQLRHVSTIEKKLFKHRYLLHMFTLYGELRAPNGWDMLASLGHPFQFLQRLSRLGSVTVRHSSSGRQPNFAGFNRGRHLYLAGRPSRSALAHILVASPLIILPSVISCSNDSSLSTHPNHMSAYSYCV